VRPVVLQIALQLGALAARDDRSRHGREVRAVDFDAGRRWKMGHRPAKGVVDAVAEAIRAGAIAGFGPVAALLDRLLLALATALSGAAVAALRLVAL
jgi:hypothetical protein